MPSDAGPPKADLRQEAQAALASGHPITKCQPGKRFKARARNAVIVK
jgi:hypothetical protein